MSLVSASICPHPPLLIPGISEKEEKEKVKATEEALKKVAKRFSNRDVNLTIIITPHGPVGESFNCLSSNQYKINLPGNELLFEGNERIVNSLTDKIKELTKTKTPRIDHGVAVPAYFIKEEIPNLKIIPITYSNRPRDSYFQLGKKLGEQLRKIDKKVSIIGSGDLSHKLKPGAPAGFSKKGEKFDKKFLELIKNKKVKEFLNMDEKLIIEAGECGYRSALVVLGSLQKENWSPEALSYEGPFGVGYSVIDFKLDEN